jgi:hypothetical protein
MLDNFDNYVHKSIMHHIFHNINGFVAFLLILTDDIRSVLVPQTAIAINDDENNKIIHAEFWSEERNPNSDFIITSEKFPCSMYYTYKCSIYHGFNSERRSSSLHIDFMQNKCLGIILSNHISVQEQFIQGNTPSNIDTFARRIVHNKITKNTILF